MASYSDMVDAVIKYYGGDYASLLNYESWDSLYFSVESAYNAIENNPNIQIIKRADGTVVGWWKKTTATGNEIKNVGQLVNSNTAGGTATSTALTNIYNSPQITKVGDTSWKLANAPAVGERWATNGGVCGAAFVVASGIKLGLTIDAALYKANEAIFHDDKLETLNPEKWKEIGTFINEQWTEMGYPTIGHIGQMVFDTITYVGQDGYSQQYIDEDAFTYAAQYLQNAGAFNKNSLYVPDDVKEIIKTTYPFTNSVLIDTNYDFYYQYIGSGKPYGHFKHSLASAEGEVRVIIFGEYGSDGVYYIRTVWASDKPFSVDSWNFNNTSHSIIDAYENRNYDEIIYYRSFEGLQTNTLEPFGNISSPVVKVGTANVIDISYALVHGIRTSSLGTGTQANATLPDFSTATDFDSFKTLLKEQYHDMWDGAVTRDVLQPDGTLKTFTYVPVPTPNTTSWFDTHPTGDGSQQNQNDTVVNPDMETSIKDSISSSGSTGVATPNPPDTGGGSSPTIVPPVGKSSSLWSIYNPTLEQVNQFGSWLWSSDFVEQLKKLFTDPMQAIIGLHKVYSPVQTSGLGTIKCGYLDSEVPSKLVSEQYVTVDCGSVDLQEYFGNVFDYSPYTDISIYLPFIGVRQLDVSDVMRSTVSVVYHVDVLTGACLAEVKVQRDAAGGTLYQFSGDAAVRYPVSSGSYMGIVSGLLGVATSLVSGNILPALSGVTRLHTNVDRSGSFTGNAGAMGSKIPYLIISRPQTAVADNFETLSGYPSNTYTPISACSGFTKVNYVHVENLTATETEKQEIERLLKEGVIV